MGANIFWIYSNRKSKQISQLIYPRHQVKTQLQSLATKQIAVGYQHAHSTLSGGLRAAYAAQGVRGLFRGISGAVPRVMVGSAVQLSSFSKLRETVEHAKVGGILRSVAP